MSDTEDAWRRIPCKTKMPAIYKIMYKYAGKNYFRRKKDYEKSTFRSYGFCYGTGHGR